MYKKAPSQEGALIIPEGDPPKCEKSFPVDVCSLFLETGYP